MNRDTPITIVLVDDDDVAAESVVRSLQRAGLDFPVVWAEDGAIALEILRGLDPARQAPRPRLVLLDLNMPRMGGLEFLRQLRSDPGIRSEVVFVLTTSDAASDREEAYREHVAGYMVKATVGPQFAGLAGLIEKFHAAVRLP